MADREASGGGGLSAGEGPGEGEPSERAEAEGSAPTQSTGCNAEGGGGTHKEPLEDEIRKQCETTPALSENIRPSWYCALKEEFSKSYFHKLSEFLVRERKEETVYPPEDQLYSWTHYCKPKDVKVVILGQDPYHKGQDHGLAFSVKKGTTLPPSLRNIYAALEKEIPGFSPPTHGHLEGWAKQGVLLLDVCLTVTGNVKNSHDKKSHYGEGWEDFTDAVTRKICQLNSKVVFLLWGNAAKEKADLLSTLIPTENVLKSCHPAAPSYEDAIEGLEFHGKFSECNDRLVEQKMEPIDWNDLP